MAGQGLSDREEIVVRPGASPLTARIRVLDAGLGGPSSPKRDIIKIVLRVLLGALFVWSGYIKLDGPRTFSMAIVHFKMDLPDNLLVDLVFIIPWTEILAGVCLIFGFFTRGAAFLIALSMVVYIVAIVSLIARGIKTDCSCFGKLDPFCKPPVGFCHIIRDVLIGVPAAYLAKVGSGPWALDRLRARQHLRRYIDK